MQPVSSQGLRLCLGLTGAQAVLQWTLPFANSGARRSHQAFGCSPSSVSPPARCGGEAGGCSCERAPQPRAPALVLRRPARDSAANMRSVLSQLLAARTLGSGLGASAVGGA